MLVKIEARILIFPGTDFYFPSTSVPPGMFFRLWAVARQQTRRHAQHRRLTELLVCTEDDVQRIIMSSPTKSCTLDPVPTYLLKESLHILPGPILSVFPALIVHSELKMCTPDFQWHLFFKHKLINK